VQCAAALFPDELKISNLEFARCGTILARLSTQAMFLNSSAAKRVSREAEKKALHARVKIRKN
jgi:hypothetical protein